MPSWVTESDGLVTYLPLNYNPESVELPNLGLAPGEFQRDSLIRAGTQAFPDGGSSLLKRSDFSGQKPFASMEPHPTIPQSLSVGMWLRIDNGGTEGFNHYVMVGQAPFEGGWGITWERDEDRKIMFRTRWGTPEYPTGVKVSTPPTKFLSDNRWVWVVATYDAESGNQALYVDGEWCGDVASDPEVKLAHGSYQVYSQGNNDHLSVGFAYSVSHFAIWDRALSSREISDGYKAFIQEPLTFDNFYQPPYPKGKYPYVTTEVSPKSSPTIEDYDPPTVLDIRNFSPTLETRPMTVKDLEYHTMEYLDGIPVSRLSETTVETVGSESWFGGGLTQGDLDDDPPGTGYKQEVLDLLTQHGIEQAPGIGPDPDIFYKPTLRITIPEGPFGNSSVYSSIYENDNLIAPPFDDPEKSYEIRVNVASFGATGSNDSTSLLSILNREDSYISFSSSVTNDPDETDIVRYNQMDVLNGSSFGATSGIVFDQEQVWRINRSQLTKCDLSAIKRIDIRISTMSLSPSTVTGNLTILLRNLRMCEVGKDNQYVRINTKTNRLEGTPFGPVIAPPVIYNVGQNKARDYSLFSRITLPRDPDPEMSPQNTSFEFYHRVDGVTPALISGVEYRSANPASSPSAPRLEVHNGIPGQPGRRDTIINFEEKEVIYQADIEKDMIRVMLWAVAPDGNKGRLLYTSQEVAAPIGIEPRAGRVGVRMMSNNTSPSVNPNVMTSSIHYVYARDTVMGEMQTSRFDTVTPLIGATLYANSSPPIQLIDDYYSGQEGGSVNHLGSPVRESGRNNGGFEIIPGTNDLTVSLDSSRRYGGLPTYRVRKHSNALIGGLQWGETIRMSDPSRSSVSGAIRFDNNIIGGSFRVVFWDEWFRNVQLILPIVIEDTPGRWHPFRIPIGTDTLMNLNYRVQVQHVGPTNGVGSFWVGDFRVQTETVEWALSNSGADKFVSATEALNTPFGAVNFTRPGKSLIARARAYHPSAWINRLEITPRWDKSGVVIVKDPPALTYESFPDIDGLETYEDIPSFFDRYADME